MGLVRRREGGGLSETKGVSSASRLLTPARHLGELRLIIPPLGSQLLASAHQAALTCLNKGPTSPPPLALHTTSCSTHHQPRLTSISPSCVRSTATSTPALIRSSFTRSSHTPLSVASLAAAVFESSSSDCNLSRSASACSYVKSNEANRPTQIRMAYTPAHTSNQLKPTSLLHIRMTYTPTHT